MSIMSLCPHCGARLSDAERNRRRCDACRASLAPAASSSDGSGDSSVQGFDATIESHAALVPPAAAPPGDPRCDATFDSSVPDASGENCSATVDTSVPPDAGGGHRDATLDSDFVADGGGSYHATLDSGLAAASAGSGSYEATLDTAPAPARDGSYDATLDSSAAVSGVPLEQTWGPLPAQSTPGMTLKGPGQGAPAKTTSLSIQPRKFRQAADRVRFGDADYDLLEVLGEGGMGVVYSARQASIDRQVAIKMLKPKMMENEGHRSKFVSEAVVTGELDHPNIVPIYDLGQNSEGALFYSMKQVQGTPWMDMILKKSLQENLDILLKVCDAVAFAHARGVIHRDLKPENIMLGEFGEVLVMDWGLAVAIEQRARSENIAQLASMGGTPAYMAPEMAQGPVERIGKHSDIYLLGAILFECVTGKRPHVGKDVMACLRAAAVNQIVPVEKKGELLDIAYKAMATAPEERYPTVQAFQEAIRAYQSHSESIALATRAAAELERACDSDDYNQYARALFGFEEACELWTENVTAQAGVSQARLCYAASAFRKGDYDLGLSLLKADDPAHADLRQQLTAAKTERDARQQRLRTAKRVVYALTAAVFVAITTGIVLVNQQRAEALRQRKAAILAAEEADRQRAEAVKQQGIAIREAAAKEQQRKRADEQRQIAETQRGIAETQRGIAETQRALAQYEAYVALIGLAAAKIDENAFGQARLLLDQCPPELRNWEWGRLMHICRQGEQQFPVQSRVDCVAFDPTGTRLATGSRDGFARVWDIATGKPLHTFAHPGAYVAAVAFSPDGRLLATGSSDPSHLLRLWDLETGASRTLAGHTDSVVGVEFSRNGAQLLTASLDNTACLWDVAAGQPLRRLVGHSWSVWSAAFSPDEKRIVTASRDGTVRVWDAATGEQLRNRAGEPMPFRGHQGAVYAAAFSPDGERIASAGFDTRVLVWKPSELVAFDFQQLLAGKEAPRQPHLALEGHTAAVRDVLFSADGNRIYSAANDNAIKVWTAREETIGGVTIPAGTLLKTIRGHGSLVCSLRRSPTDATLLASASHDGYARLWRVDRYEEERVIPGLVLQGHADAILAAAFSDDGTQIVTASRDRTAKTWDAATGALEQTFREGHAYLASQVLFFPDGKRLLTAAGDNSVRIWSIDTGVEILRLEGTGNRAAAALSPEGRWIVTGSDRRDVARRDGRETIAAYAHVYDAQTGKRRHTLGHHAAPVTAAAVSPNSQLAFTGDVNGRGNLWELETGRLLHTIAHQGRIAAAAFSPDGGRLLTASDDKVVFQWDLRDLGRIQRLDNAILKHPDAVNCLALSADGRRVLTGCEDGVARLWDVDRAEAPRWASEALPGGRVSAVALSPDEKLALVVDDRHNLVRLLDAASGQEMAAASAGAPGPLARLTHPDAVFWSAQFAPDGAALVTIGGDEARLWDLQGQALMSFAPHRTVAYASFSPDRQRLVTASWDNSARLWDATTGQALLKLADPVAGPEGAHTQGVNSAVFSPDGHQVLTASDDGTLKLWDAATGRVVRTFRGHGAGVRYATFSHDGKQVLSASADNTARIWDAATGQERAVLRGHRLPVLHASFSPDDKLVVTGSEDFSAKLWNAETGEELRTLPPQTARIAATAFSPDGQRVLTGCGDHLVKLWDANTGKEILTLKGHAQEVTAVAFSSDGRTALTASRDGTAMLWPAADWKAPPTPLAQVDGSQGP